jgi:tRNA-specific 2-thiouridylase
VIGPREELLGRGVVAREINWLVDEAPAPGSHVQLQVRHRATATPAEVLRIDDNEVELALDQPVAAITPGQSLVIYDGERVLGGGIIESSSGARAPSRIALPVVGSSLES